MAEDEPLTAQALVGLLQGQLEGLTAQVEARGTELNALLGALLGLVERHRQEAGALPQAGAAWAQLAADHETMAGFAGPLTTVAQYTDRLRQRLEHLQAALALLPAAPLRPGQRAAAERLFPLEEERRALAEALGLDEPEPAEPGVELF